MIIIECFLAIFTIVSVFCFIISQHSMKMQNREQCNYQRVDVVKKNQRVLVSGIAITII